MLCYGRAISSQEMQLLSYDRDVPLKMPEILLGDWRGPYPTNQPEHGNACSLHSGNMPLKTGLGKNLIEFPNSMSTSSHIIMPNATIDTTCKP